jgi:hypothetical protein
MRRLESGLQGADYRENLKPHEPVASEGFMSALLLAITFASLLIYLWQSLVIVEVFEEFNRLLDKFLF